MDRECGTPGAKEDSCRHDACGEDGCDALAVGGSRIGRGCGCAGQSSCETESAAGGIGGEECGADSAQEERQSAGDGRRDAVLRAREGDEEAFSEAVVENLPLVAHIAKRFSRAEAEYEDLFQSGCIGLMKAVRRYEPGFGTAFSTYAVPVIMGEIRRLLRDGGQVHVARSIREKAALIAKCEEELTAQTGSAPTFAQISEKTGLT
ncbi:MAG: sigma-70 family RNA polymerase sigma factor, partial [Clostridia bacterium]|nr:sigma-70 family RNA polymerase sigma factor [Clostridia bacterium]